MHEDQFFVGKKSERLSEEAGLKLLKSLPDEKRRRPTAAAFATEWCQPQQVVEKFVRRMDKEFGDLAQGPQARRIAEYLFSGAVRPHIIGCVAKKVPLEGLNEDNPGIVVVR